MPPELVRFHCCIVCIGASIKLPLEMEGPVLLPLAKRHVDRGESILYILKPCLVARRHRHQAYIKRPTPIGKIVQVPAGSRPSLSARPAGVGTGPPDAD